MKSLQLLLFLTPLACLLAQAPPASQPANPPAPAGQPARPPAVALQPPAPAVAHVPPETVVLTIGEEKITAADLDRMIDMLPEQYRAQMRTTGRRQFAERLVSLKVMAPAAHKTEGDQDEDEDIKQAHTWRIARVRPPFEVELLKFSADWDEDEPVWGDEGLAMGRPVHGPLYHLAPTEDRARIQDHGLIIRK